MSPFSVTSATTDADALDMQIQRLVELYARTNQPASLDV